ncbi:MAG: ABC transporter transmembrane domain-containing protein, partial [Planctomycetota bacterium]
MLRTTFRFLVHYAGPYRWRFLLGLAAVLLAVQANAFVPRIVQMALDYLGNGFGDTTYLIEVAALVTIVSLIGMGGMFLMRRILVDTSRDVEYDIRRDFFAHLETLSFRVYAGQRTGDLMSRATADIEGVRMLCGPAVMHFAFTAMLTPTVIVWMVTISPWLTVISFIPFVLVSILVRIIAGRMFRLSLETQARLADVSNKGQENFAGIRVVKAFAQETAEGESFALAAAASRDANLRLG